jgi:tetratricopeptide (TPR) repeat protein
MEQEEPDRQASPAYGGSASCRECHEDEYAHWAKSHHALAERQPDEARENIAFIPPHTFKNGLQAMSFCKTNGHYEVITTGLQGTNETFFVERILAENPLRQMLLPFPGGRWQATEVAWDPRSNEWFDVYGQENRRPGEWGHWTGRGMNWNSMCATCHNTRAQKNYDVSTDSYHTTRIEHGVGCEACHGPMKAHNDWQHAHKNSHLRDPTIRKLTRDEMFETCAPCHSRRSEITGDSKPGDAFLDNYMISIADDSDTFFPDGQIHDEDYEVTAFMGSRMFQHGVRCLDCHDIHTMKPKLPGNFLCLQCHASGAAHAPIINPVLHSHHQVFGYNTNGALKNIDLSAYNPAQIKETGGECVNCHMPQTVYMQRHWRHDHGFTIPDPLLTKQFNLPNACERCHADKGTDWNLKYVEQWYGTNMDRPYRQHAQIVARARQGDDGVVQPLVTMLDSNDSFYWRAVAANLLERWCDERPVTTALLSRLNDTNALVRQMVIRSLTPLLSRADVSTALQLRLSDPSRNVRVEAAGVFAATLDTNSLAGREYLQFLDHAADQPLGQLQCGLFDFQRGDPTNALKHFMTAVKWDPYSPGIRQELAMLLSKLGRASDAVKELETAVKLAPGVSEYHYKLALAYNETSEQTKVLPELETAVRLDPKNAGAGYNLGLARNAAGDPAGAIRALLAAESGDPYDPRIPYARATIHAQLGQLNEAALAARRALEIDPGFTDAKTLLNQLHVGGFAPFPLKSPLRTNDL